MLSKLKRYHEATATDGYGNKDKNDISKNNSSKVMMALVSDVAQGLLVTICKCQIL
jgi:hypothetical protein